MPVEEVKKPEGSGPAGELGIKPTILIKGAF
jgi:hypothetical protein